MVNGRTAQRYARVVVSVDKGPMKNRVHIIYKNIYSV